MQEFFYDYIKQELKKRGIDINSDDYINNIEYIKIKYLTKIMYGSNFVSYDYFVEKFLVGQERINNIKGKYDFGTIRNMNIKDISYDSLVEDINDCIPITNETALKNNIKQNIQRKEFGLIARIERAFNIEFDNFSNEKINKFKILKLFYLIEEVNGINLIKMINNPTLENVDNSCLDDVSDNGKIIAQIKSEISKELTLDFMKNAKESIFTIVNSWSREIEKIYGYIEKSSFDDFDSDMNLIGKRIEVVAEMLNKNECKIKHKHSLLETIYLKVLQMENKGGQVDYIKINKHILESINNQEKEWIIEVENEVVDYDDIEKYIKDNVKKIATLVFNREVVTSNDYKKIRGNIENVIQIIKYIEQNNFVIMKDKVNLHLLIACYQEIMNKEKEVYQNTYHGYTTPHPTISSELSNRDSAKRASKKIWTRKVIKRYLLIHGYRDIYLSICKIEELLDNIMIYILSIPNIDDMIFVNSYIHILVNNIIHSSIEVERYSRYLFNEIKKVTRYSILCNKNILYSIVEEFFKVEQMEYLIDVIISFINTYRQGNQCYDEIEIEVLSINEVIIYDYVISFFISPKNYIFEIKDVYKKYNTEAKNKFKELGISINES